MKLVEESIIVNRNRFYFIIYSSLVGHCVIPGKIILKECENENLRKASSIKNQSTEKLL